MPEGSPSDPYSFGEFRTSRFLYIYKFPILIIGDLILAIRSIKLILAVFIRKVFRLKHIIQIAKSFKIDSLPFREIQLYTDIIGIIRLSQLCTVYFIKFFSKLPFVYPINKHTYILIQIYPDTVYSRREIRSGYKITGKMSATSTTRCRITIKPAFT